MSRRGATMCLVWSPQFRNFTGPVPDMSKKSNIELPEEFASAMQQLVAEAAKSVPPRAQSEVDESASSHTAEQFAALEERLAGFERSLSEGLAKLSSPAASESAGLAPQLAKIEEHLTALRNTESVNHRLF